MARHAFAAPIAGQCVQTRRPAIGSQRDRAGALPGSSFLRGRVHHAIGHVFGASVNGRASFAAPARRFFVVQSKKDEDERSRVEMQSFHAPPVTVPMDQVAQVEQERAVALQERLRGTALDNTSAETIRNIVLLLTLFPLLSNYFCYDIVAALQTYIKAAFSVDNVGFSQLYTVYEVPNIIMPLIGGAIIDKVGPKRGAFLFACIVLFGVATVASGPFLNAYWIMLLGRVLYGLGAEALNVTMDVIFAKWFSGKGMAFASGVGVFACRLGDVLSFNAGPPVAERLGGFQYALLMAPAAAAISAAAMFAYGHFDDLADHAASVSAAQLCSPSPAKTPASPEPEAQAQPVVGGPLAKVTELLGPVAELPPVFWLIAAISFCYYSTYFPFQAFAPAFMAQKFAYTTEQAARVTSLMGFVSMWISPVAGFAVDRVGKRAFIAALYPPITLPCIVLLALSPAAPYLPVAAMGAIFSFVPAAIWPALAVLIEPRLHGVAYGSLTSIINIGLLLSYFAVGKAADMWGILTGVPAVLLGFVSVGLGLAIVWNIVDAASGGIANATDEEITAILQKRSAEAEAAEAKLD